MLVAVGVGVVVGVMVRVGVEIGVSVGFSTGVGVSCTGVLVSGGVIGVTGVTGVWSTLARELRLTCSWDAKSAAGSRTISATMAINCILDTGRYDYDVFFPQDTEIFTKNQGGE